MIKDYHFGSMTIGGKTYQKDLKIIHGQVLSGWWRKEGHSVDVEDLDDIFSAKPEVLVVGMGQPGRMQVTETLRAALLEAGIETVEEPTDQAIHTFNRLYGQGRKVAGAFHLTC